MILNGYQVFKDDNLVKQTFTKIQTRKFTNNRWCKKYLKKYTKTVPDLNIYELKHMNIRIMHPFVYNKLQLELEKQKRVEDDIKFDKYVEDNNIRIYDFLKRSDTFSLYAPPISNIEILGKINFRFGYGINILTNPNMGIYVNCS